MCGLTMGQALRVSDRGHSCHGRPMTAVLSNDAATLPELLYARARELGDALFVRDARIAWSYEEFGRRVTEVAGGLRSLGVDSGDVVAVILPNCPQYLEAWWGIL